MAKLSDSHHILVADDDPTICALLEQILVQGGHSVVTCYDGREALEVARNDVFSLLILDFQMPCKTGVEVIHELRKQGDSVPVILMSAGLNDASLQSYEDLERVACLYKPFLLSNIQTAIDAALHAKTGSREEKWLKMNGAGGSMDDNPPDELPTRKPPITSDERREFQRFGLDETTVSLKGVGLLSLFSRKSENICSGVDLSEGGVRILASEKIETGARLNVTLRLERLKDEFQASGEVCWCRWAGNEETAYDVGLRFIEPDAPRDQKISMMRGWFTSPDYRPARD